MSRRSLLMLGIGVCSLTLAYDAQASDTLVASYYGEELRGSLTASGKPFDPDGLTAASQTFPLGTRLLVKHEGRGVVVTVDDRGPAERDLDLSEGAAEVIGLKEEGVGAVEVEQVEAAGSTELPKTGGPHVGE